jgi:hypothetical protein
MDPVSRNTKLFYADVGEETLQSNTGIAQGGEDNLLY